MSKVVENTYRDVNIAFANGLAKICRNDNMDVYEIIRIVNKHPQLIFYNLVQGSEVIVSKLTLGF